MLKGSRPLGLPEMGSMMRPNPLEEDLDCLAPSLPSTRIPPCQRCDRSVGAGNVKGEWTCEGATESVLV